MNALLINNRTKRIKQVENLLKDHSVDTINMWNLPEKEIDKYDFIVLSGSHFDRASTKQKTYDDELEIIKNINKPIFGICMGMELIARAYSNPEFIELAPRHRGIIEISYKNKQLKVYESHRWKIKTVTDPLEEVSRTDDGVEIIKHKSKPIWGVQFHPEADEEFGTNGKIVFYEFLDLIT